MVEVTCQDVRRRLWALIDGDLDEADRAEMETHLTGCEACRREMAVRRRVWAALDLDAVPPGRDLTQRVLNRVALASRRRVRRRRLAWGGVAAAACLVLAVTLSLLLAPHEPTEPFDPGTPYLETQLVVLDEVSDIELLYFADVLETFVNGDEPPNGI